MVQVNRYSNKKLKAYGLPKTHKKKIQRSAVRDESATERSQKDGKRISKLIVAEKLDQEAEKINQGFKRKVKDMMIKMQEQEKLGKKIDERQIRVSGIKKLKIKKR